MTRAALSAITAWRRSVLSGQGTVCRRGRGRNPYNISICIYNKVPGFNDNKGHSLCVASHISLAAHILAKEAAQTFTGTECVQGQLGYIHLAPTMNSIKTYIPRHLQCQS